MSGLRMNSWARAAELETIRPIMTRATQRCERICMNRRRGGRGGRKGKSLLARAACWRIHRRIVWRKLAIVIGIVARRALRTRQKPAREALRATRPASRRHGGFTPKTHAANATARKHAAEAFNPFFNHAGCKLAHKGTLAHVLTAALRPVVERGRGVEVKALARAGAGHVHARR